MCVFRLGSVLGYKNMDSDNVWVEIEPEKALESL